MGPLIIRVTALCVAVAMIASALRPQRPELATAISLAGGLAAVALLWGEAGQARQWLKLLTANTGGMDEVTVTVLKGAGVAIVSELGAQVCADAGESALAGRVALAARVAMLSLCAPLLARLYEAVNGALG